MLIGYIVCHSYISLFSNWLNCFLDPPLLGQKDSSPAETRAMQPGEDVQDKHVFAKISYLKNINGYISYLQNTNMDNLYNL